MIIIIITIIIVSLLDISRDAKSLIKGLLTVDQTRRLTIDQAISHPWYKNVNDNCFIFPSLLSIYIYIFTIYVNIYPYLFILSHYKQNNVYSVFILFTFIRFSKHDQLKKYQERHERKFATAVASKE